MRERLSTTTPGHRVVRLDQGQQRLPWNDLLHLVQEQLTARALALSEALSISECQLHHRHLNMALNSRSGRCRSVQRFRNRN